MILKPKIKHAQIIGCMVCGTQVWEARIVSEQIEGGGQCCKRISVVGCIPMLLKMEGLLLLLKLEKFGAN